MSHLIENQGKPQFELRAADGFPVVDSKFQASMPEALWRMPNRVCYGGKIETKEPVGGFPQLPEGWTRFLRTNFYPDMLERDELTPAMERKHYLKILGHRHMTGSPGPHANFTSFNVVWDLVEKMQPVFGESMNEDVVVLTPYSRQRDLYMDKLRECGEKGWAASMLPQVAVVDNAVRREWKVVILDYVNCTEKTLGFLQDKTRTFVMFTRMTAALIAVGSDISTAEWEAADNDSETAWSYNKKSESGARAFAGGLPSFQSRRRRNKPEPLIIDMLNEFSREGCCSDAPHFSFHPLDPPQDILSSFDTGALKKFLHYLQNVRGLEVTSKEMLDADTYTEYLKYRELYRSMIDTRFEAIKEGKLREFTGSVEGYETPEEALRIERIKNKTRKDKISPWSSPAVLPTDGTLSINDGGSNNMASMTDGVDGLRL